MQSNEGNGMEKYTKLLDQIMGVEEAAEKWNLSKGHIKTLCRTKVIPAKKLGRDWAIPSDFPNPKVGTGKSRL